MSTELEKFIRENKRQFDVCEPPAGLWEKIDQRLDEKVKKEKKAPKVVRLTTFLSSAAAIVIVLGAGFFFWQFNKPAEGNIDISYIDPQLAKQQVHYASLIEGKQEEIKEIQKVDPHLYKEFSAELEKMDQSYQKLKNELGTSPNQQRTVKAMIRNLEVQIQVLNQQLKIIEQINQYKNDTQSI